MSQRSPHYNIHEDEEDLEAERIVNKYLGIPEPEITTYAEWALANQPPKRKKKPLPRLQDRVTVKPLPTFEAWTLKRERTPSPPRQQQPPKESTATYPPRTIYRRGVEGGYTFDGTDTSRTRRLHYGYDDRSAVYVTNPWSEEAISSTDSLEVDEAAMKYKRSMNKLNNHINNL